MLDDFASTKPEVPNEDPPKPANEPSAKDDATEADLLDSDEFAKEFQDQMAALMGDVGDNSEIKQEFENAMRQVNASSDAGSTAFKGDGTFQNTIQKTIERMQASSDKAVPDAKEDDAENVLGQLLKEMQSEGLNTEGDDEGLNKMLLGMMEQLTNKDILYDPMKELHDKFPEWIAKNRAVVRKEDLKRYEQQHQLVREIVQRFESKTYSDSNAADREYIVDRMQKVSASIPVSFRVPY